MKQRVKAGTTDFTTLVFIPDPASTDGSGKTGLTASNLTVSYTRVEIDNDVTITDATSSLNDLSALTDAHNDWGLKEVSSTLAPGLYRLDVADAVFASGAVAAVVYAMITTSAAAASPMEFIIGASVIDDIPSATQNADALLLRDWTEIPGVGSAPARCLLQAARFLRNAWSVVAGAVSVTKEDDTTVAYTKSVTSDPDAEPITGVGADS